MNYISIISLTALLSALIITYLFLSVLDKIKTDIVITNIIGNNHTNKTVFDTLKNTLNLVKYNKDETKRNLITAGIHNDFIANVYYAFKMTLFLLLVIFLAFNLIYKDMSVISFIVSFITGMLFFIIAPDVYITSRGKKNISRMNQRLPFLLDLMNICIHTGMTIELTLEYLAKELKIVDKDLAYVIQKTVERIHIVGIEKAFNEFHIMIPTPEAQSLSMTILNNITFGSSIGPVLVTLASDIREINMLDLEEKIGKMSAKMSIPMIVFIMIPIVILITAPGIMRMFM